MRGEGKIRAGVRDGVGYNSEGRKREEEPSCRPTRLVWTLPEGFFGMLPAEVVVLGVWCRHFEVDSLGREVRLGPIPFSFQFIYWVGTVDDAVGFYFWGPGGCYPAADLGCCYCSVFPVNFHLSSFRLEFGWNYHKLVKNCSNWMKFLVIRK